MISLDRVSRTFEHRTGELEALRDIDLEIDEHRFVAVIGRSGRGQVHPAAPDRRPAHADRRDDQHRRHAGA